MKDKLLIVTSFGTTHEETCEKNIAAAERAMGAACPGWDVARAFTSGMIIRALAGRGVLVDEVPAALVRAREQGYRQVALAPTHLLYGDEYEKLCRQSQACEAYNDIPVGEPLLASTEDMQAVVAALAEEYPAAAGTALVLMGHGTGHYVNPVYAALEYMFHRVGREDVIVGTVEAYPGLDEVLAQVKKGSFAKAVLAPLMLVAGDHAANDMAGPDEDSWASRLAAAGLTVQSHLRGLGELPAVQRLYAAHAQKLTGG